MKKMKWLASVVFACMLFFSGKASAETATYTNSLGMTFKPISSGTFMMGSPPEEVGRWPNEGFDQVTISNDYYIQTTEVTQAQWVAVTGNNPSYFSNCPDCPVENVSWDDVMTFIGALNSMEEGGTYRLPTEAEWEYACRAGTDTAFANGGILFEVNCGPEPNLEEMGWYCGNWDNRTHEVAGKSPNSWGLYDMHGNVWEWCQEWYDDPAYPTYRVLRGGSIGDHSRCRSAGRGGHPQDGVHYGVGFRLVASPPPAETCFAVNMMKVMDKKTNIWRDKIKIKGTIGFGPGSDPFDPPPAVTASITFGEEPPQVITVTFPPESFVEDVESGNYISHIDIDEVSNAKIQINPNECFWKLMIKGEDVSGLYESDGAIVELAVGDYVGKDTIVAWTKRRPKCSIPKTRFVMFKADPQVNCCDPLSNGLIAYYPFSGDASDETGNGHDGVVYEATLTTDRNGNADSAYHFDGAGDYIEVLHAADLTPAEITITAWINVESVPGSWPAVVNKVGPSAPGYDGVPGYSLEFNGPAGIRFISHLEGVSGPPASPSVTFPFGEWHFVAGVYDGSGFTLYLDGDAYGPSDDPGTLYQPGNNLKIGGSSAGSRFFNGIIDEVRIYNRGLSQTEIQALYALP